MKALTWDVCNCFERSILKTNFRRGHIRLLLLCIVLCLPAFAQRNTGSVVGVVTDSTGAAMPNAAITVTNVDTSVLRTEATEKTGNYRVVSLPPGRYKIAAAAPGFSSEVRDGITLSVDQDARVDFALKIGAANQAITVTSDAPLVNTESGELGTTLNSQQVTDLPSFQRNILASLPLLSPGVGLAKQQFDNNPPLRFSVNGGRALSEDLVVDGAEALSVNISAWGSFVPNQDAVQEMKFQTNAYAAENGRGTATVNIITKSGTNQFHGGIYDYLKNEDFNANDYFNKRNQLASGQPNRVSRLRDNLYGGDLGGPIWRDKLFFFLQYERHPVTNPGSTLSDVPTVAFKNGDFSALLAQGIKIYDPATTVTNPAFNSAQPASASNPQYLRTPFPNNIIPSNRFDPVAVAALKFLPDPNFGATGAIFQNEFVNTPSSGIGWQVDPRVDYAISEKQLLFFRLNHNSGTNYSGGKWPGNNPADNNHSTSKYPAWVGVLGHTYSFNAHLINDFRWGIERDISVISFPGSGQDYAAKLGVKNSNAENFPQFGFGVPNAGYGMGPGNALNQWEQTIQYADAVTYLKGKHAFKFGGDVRLNQVNKQTGRNTPSGAFGFSGFYTSNIYPGSTPTVSMADMLLGLVNNYNIQPADFVWGARKKEASWFVQDDWKLTHNLTLNLGLRQDLQFTWKEVQNRYTAFSPTLINPTNGLPGALVFGATGSNGTKPWNFAPRVGFAWTPFGNQKTVVRGGAGKFITPASTIEDYGDTGQGQELGYSASASAASNSYLTPAFILQNGGPAAVLPTHTAGLNSNTPGKNDVGFSPLYVNNGEATPAVYTWSLTLARELPQHLLVEASFVGTRATHLPFERSLNQIPLAKAAGATSIVQANMPYPQYGNVSGRFHDANSSFNSFQLKVEQKAGKNLNWTLAYTLAKSMDLSSLDPTISWGGAQWNGSGVQDIYNLRANWARSAFDQRHKVGASFIYQLPFGPNQKFLNHGVAGRVVGGWQVNSVIQAHTGQPIEFNTSVNASQTNNAILRPNCVAGAGFKNAHPTIANWWNWGAFSNPAPNTFGNCGRDLSAVPGYQEVDLSLLKNFSFRTPLNENTALQFRAEAFNALNRTNYALPSATVPTNNILSQVPPSGTTSNLSNFGQINGDVNGPRTMTLALKLIF
jgi:hypothetical protein